MAQVTIKGFISKIGELENVGKNKDIPKLSITVIDDTRAKSVGFFVDFWRDMTKQAQLFKKGSRVMVKATVEDGTYEREENGNKTKVYGYRFNATQIISCVEKPDEDLDKEFERQLAGQQRHTLGLIPTDESTPFDDKK